MFVFFILPLLVYVDIPGNLKEWPIRFSGIYFLERLDAVIMSMDQRPLDRHGLVRTISILI